MFDGPVGAPAGGAGFWRTDAGKMPLADCAGAVGGAMVDRDVCERSVGSTDSCLCIWKG